VKHGFDWTVYFNESKLPKIKYAQERQNRAFYDVKHVETLEDTIRRKLKEDKYSVDIQSENDSIKLLKQNHILSIEG
jgi:hypothetical protein